MSESRLKKKIIKDKLFNKRRLIILNEDTFEETFSLKLSVMNVFIVASLGAIIIITVTTFIIAFTPLREYIPGYSSSTLKKNATELALKSDSIEVVIKKNEAYLNAIKKVLNGEIEPAKFSKDSIKSDVIIEPSTVDFDPSKAELELREQQDKSKLTKKK
jgi:hypothetical protein